MSSADNQAELKLSKPAISYKVLYIVLDSNAIMLYVPGDYQYTGM